MLDIYNLVEKKRMLNYIFFTAKKNRLLQLRNVDKKINLLVSAVTNNNTVDSAVELKK